MISLWQGTEIIDTWAELHHNERSVRLNFAMWLKTVRGGVKAMGAMKHWILVKAVLSCKHPCCITFLSILTCLG